jgi:hypothetical protein
VLAVLKEGDEFYNTTRNDIILLNYELRKRTLALIGVLDDNRELYHDFFQEVEGSHDVTYKIIYIRREKLAIIIDKINECKRDLNNIKANEKTFNSLEIRKGIPLQKKYQKN